MDDERQESIREALQSYRQRVRDLNISLIPENTTGRERLINNKSLDGVHDGPVDAERKDAWFARISNAIAEADLDTDMPRPPSLPADLLYLCTLVNGICGPGLPDWRHTQQIDFITVTSQAVWEPECTTKERVLQGIRPDDDLDVDTDAARLNSISFNWRDWQISLAVCIGEAEYSRAGTYIIYCRRSKPTDDMEEYDDDEAEEDEEDEWKESDEQWQWRYGTHDGDWQSRLYHNVEDFLAWYARCKIR